MLRAQLGHGLRAAAAGRLVGGDMYAAYVRYLLYGIQRHDHLYGGAVGVGDDVARGVERIAGIDLGDDQRHVRIHTEGA